MDEAMDTSMDAPAQELPASAPDDTTTIVSSIEAQQADNNEVSETQSAQEVAQDTQEMEQIAQELGVTSMGREEDISLDDSDENTIYENPHLIDAHASQDQYEHDGLSLFIPEQRITPSASGPLTNSHLSFRLSTESHTLPASGSTPLAASESSPLAATKPTVRLAIFAKIRAMQEKARTQKAASTQQLHSYETSLDSENYLNAIQPGNSRAAAAPSNTFGDDHDKHDKVLAEEFKKAKRRFEELKKSNGGNLTHRQDIEWLKCQKQEIKRIEKKKRDARKDRQEAMPSHEQYNIDHEIQLDEDATSLFSSQRTRPIMNTEEAPRMSIQQAELRAMEVALEAAKDSGKKKRKPASENNSASEPRPKRSRGRGAPSQASSSGSKKPRKMTKAKAKAKNQTAQAVNQVASLMNADIFAQQAGPDSLLEATFSSRNKAKALKEMLATIPVGGEEAAKNDKNLLVQAMRDFNGRGAVKSDGRGMWIVKGMKTSLKGFQIVGSGFMRRRENATEEPRGGLMADQMGLGKTLMTLTNIVNGYPGKFSDCKTTLIVASPSLLTQWKKEIELHTNIRLNVMRYTQLESNLQVDVLKSHDIVLATYADVMRSYPKNEPPMECQTVEEKIEWWKQTYECQRGPLHRMMFLRIVLDEAQAIKNHTGRTSIACRALLAHHRWALSGTPIVNGLTELYPYFKFLGVPYTGSFKTFKHNYCGGPESETVERLVVRLSQFMIRRTHGDEMFGAPILKLPQASQTTFYCDFNSVERNIYEIVQKRFYLRLGRLARESKEKAYSNGLVMLLRLRQLTSSLLMLQSVIQDLAEREDIEKIRDVVNEAAAHSTSRQARFISKLCKQLDAAYKAAKECSKDSTMQTLDDDEHIEEPDDDDDDEGASTQNGKAKSGKGFGKTFNFKPYINSIATGDSWEKARERAKCGDCGQHPEIYDYPWMTSCGHILCSRCYENAQIKQAEGDFENATCVACGAIFTFAREMKDDDELGRSVRTTRSKGKERADKKRRHIEEQDIKEEWLEFGKEGVLPSAKTIAIKAQILNWFQEDEDVKIIIYTQFLAMIRILSRVCQEEGWGAEQYHGKLSFKAREKAIQVFADNPKTRILLASMRCGGLGLNLTMASRVIVIDPWWNEAAEQQAFCRVFRFGQRSQTSLTRLCVRNSVDDRIIAMQVRKQEEIDSVMEDKDTVGKMSVADLLRLFGNLNDDENENRRPFLLVDNPPLMGGFGADADYEGYADDI